MTSIFGNKRLIFITLLFLTLLGVQFYLKALITPSKQLEKYYQVPAFSLTNSQGDTVTRERFAGKVWVANFIFTTCGGPCPVMTRNLASVQKSLQGKKGVAFLSVTVHPAYDTPEVLADYAREFSADTQSWEFVTGDIDSIRALAVQGFKLQASEELAAHSNRFALVDAEGFVRKYYDGTSEEDMEILKKDILSLL